MIKIKATHAKSKRTFKAKGDLLWTVKVTDRDGNDLAPIESLSPQLCLQHLAQFVNEAIGKTTSKSRSLMKGLNAKSSGKNASKNAPKKVSENNEQRPGVSLKMLTLDDDS